MRQAIVLNDIDYNVVNDGKGSVGGDKRLYGIYNMSINIPGYQTVWLVKDDVCLHPHLFTILGNILSDDNMLVQRWACVKWFLPLSFGFQVRNNVLQIYSSIFKFKIVSLFRARETIYLTKEPNNTDKNVLDENLRITVSVNGRTAVVEQKTIVQIYSLSGLLFNNPLGIVARLLL